MTPPKCCRSVLADGTIRAAHRLLTQPFSVCGIPSQQLADQQLTRNRPTEPARSRAGGPLGEPY
jgi:hypothetical protein